MCHTLVRSCFGMRAEETLKKILPLHKNMHILHISHQVLMMLSQTVLVSSCCDKMPEINKLKRRKVRSGSGFWRGLLW